MYTDRRVAWVSSRHAVSRRKKVGHSDHVFDPLVRLGFFVGDSFDVV